MRIFVTGATGVIGRRAVPRMLAAGHRVTAVGRSHVAREALEQAGASTINLDLFDGEDVRLAMADHDAVVNLATHIPRPGVRPFLPGAWTETNRLRKIAVPILVDAALQNGVKRFVQESFAPIYPDSGDRWITEDVAPRPARYNRTALAAEAAVERFTRGGGTGVILRFALFYGAKDTFTSMLFDSVRRGWLPIIGPPDGFVSMVSHEDAAAAVAAALDAPGGVYNVVDEPLTRQALGDAIAALLGVEPPKIPPAWLAKLGGSLGETLARSLRISNGKLRAATRWSPRYASAREGLRAFAPAPAPSASGRATVRPAVHRP